MKSQLDICVELLLATLDDVATHLSYQTTDAWNDGRVITRRATSEGLQFVTVTLPSLAKALDKALATDALFETPPGFKTRRDSRLPVFLGSLFEQIFDEFGIQRRDASVQAVSCVRQVCYLFYKLSLPPSQTQIDETINRFKQNEEELQHKVGPSLVLAEEAIKGVNPFDAPLLPDQIDLPTLVLARRLICAVLATSDPKDEKFRPKHGPGAVATGEKEAEKMIWKRYYTELAREFPYPDYFYFNLSHLCDDLQGYLSLEELSEPTAKVVLVPKDSRGPRLISSEPLEVQWIQQMLMANLVSTIERHPLTRGLVNFTDQTINRRLALRGSLSESNHLVTLDMKDASDRVHSTLVRMLFPDTWVAALMAARSTHTLLPNGQRLRLEKFAPMGSATCFPVEALIFWALSTATIIEKSTRVIINGHPIATSPFASLTKLLARRSGGCTRTSADEQRNVYVYGDDIILHREDYADVERTFSSVGLILNKDKCCVGTTFRESCGCDAFRGFDVTPLRMKATWSSQLTPNEVLSHAAFQRAMVERCWFNTARVMADLIQTVISLPRYRIERDPKTGLAQSERPWVHMLMPDDSQAATAQYGMDVRVRYNKRTGITHYQRLYYKASSPSKYDDGASRWGEILRKESTRLGPNSLNLETLAKRNVRRRPPTPVGKDVGLLNWATHLSPMAKACWYTSARQVSLRRVWVDL